jgi:magnesium chelatase accessory protein
LAPLTRRLAASRTVAKHLTSRLGESRKNITRLIQSTGSTISSEGVELYVRLAHLPNHVNGVLSMMAAWDLGDLLRRLPRLGVPLQLLCGTNDRMVPPAQARRLADEMPGASLTMLKGLGHLAHEEQPARFVEFLCQRGEAAVRRKVT